MDSAWLHGLFNLRGKLALGLEPMAQLIGKLQHPERGLKAVHFAGTNGKGSTLVALEALLIASGAQVFSFTSPHMVFFNERFRLQGLPISDSKLLTALDLVCQALGVGRADLQNAEVGKLGASFFEISFALALLLAQGSDWFLVETGLGGRLDATNVLPHPVATVLTSIGIDHTEYLGEDLASITTEKMGIFKPGTPVFLAPQVGAVADQVRLETKNKKLELIEAQPQTLDGLPLGLAGRHQQANVATALAVYQHLYPKATQLSASALASCLAGLSWPGRLEYLQPNLLVDGAHNQQGFSALIDFLKQQHPGQKILLALGWMSGKHLLESFDPAGLEFDFLPLIGQYARAEPHPERSLRPLGPTLGAKTVALAWQEWEAGCFGAYDLWVVAGSLYLIGELKALMEPSPVVSGPP